MLVLRTRCSIFKSRPSVYLWLSTPVVTIVAVAIPYLPFGVLLGSTPLPLYALLLLLIIALYVVVSEVAKRVYFARV